MARVVLEIDGIRHRLIPSENGSLHTCAKCSLKCKAKSLNQGYPCVALSKGRFDYYFIKEENGAR